MTKFVNLTLTALLLIILASAFFYAGTYFGAEVHYDQVVVDVDSDLLTAAKIYHGVPDAELFYIGDTLCFRRDGVICYVKTGAFLHWFHESYLKDSEHGGRNANN